MWWIHDVLLIALLEIAKDNLCKIGGLVRWLLGFAVGVSPYWILFAGHPSHDAPSTGKRGALPMKSSCHWTTHPCSLLPTFEQQFADNQWFLIGVYRDLQMKALWRRCVFTSVYKYLLIGQLQFVNYWQLRNSVGTAQSEIDFLWQSSGWSADI